MNNVMYEKNIKKYIYVCPCCFNKIDNCTCLMLPWTLIQIDRNILPIIKVLNKKGYYTTDSCEGHIGANEIMHIFFKNSYKIKKTLPKGIEYKNGVVMATITGSSETAKRRNKKKLLNSLYEWACDLDIRIPLGLFSIMSEENSNITKQ